MEEDKPKRLTPAEKKDAMRDEVMAELDAAFGARSVQSFLIERVNAKYAQRIFQKINTEWERRWNSGQIEGVSEFKWMLAEVKKVFEEEMKLPATWEEAVKLKAKEKIDEEKTKDEI